jgi:hypothetical protein
MGQFRTFLSWYRLKSNSQHVFLKIYGSKYLEEQPETVEEAAQLARETLEACQDLRNIVTQDHRELVVMLDMRGCDVSEANFITFFKYCSVAASQGLDIDRVEVRGASSLWTYICKFLPKYTRDRIILIDTA